MDRGQNIPREVHVCVYDCCAPGFSLDAIGDSLHAAAKASPVSSVKGECDAENDVHLGRA